MARATAPSRGWPGSNRRNRSGIPGDGREPPQSVRGERDGHRRSEEVPAPGDDHPEHLLGVQGRDRARQVGEPLGLVPPPLRVVVQRGVPERQRGLPGEGGEDGVVVRAERARAVAAAAQRDHAEELVGHPERLRHHPADAARHGVGEGVGPRRVVVDDDALPGAGTLARHARAHGDRRLEDVVAGARGEVEPVAGEEVDRPLGLDEPGGAVHDEAQQPVQVELGDQLVLDGGPGVELLAEEFGLGDGHPAHPRPQTVSHFPLRGSDPEL